MANRKEHELSKLHVDKTEASILRKQVCLDGRWTCGFKLKERNKRQRSENCWSQNWSVWLSRMVHHDGLNNDADWVKRYMTMEVDGTRQERKSQWHCVKYDRKTVFFPTEIHAGPGQTPDEYGKIGHSKTTAKKETNGERENGQIKERSY